MVIIILRIIEKTLFLFMLFYYLKNNYGNLGFNNYLLILFMNNYLVLCVLYYYIFLLLFINIIA